MGVVSCTYHNKCFQLLTKQAETDLEETQESPGVSDPPKVLMDDFGIFLLAMLIEYIFTGVQNDCSALTRLEALDSDQCVIQLGSGFRWRF